MEIKKIKKIKVLIYHFDILWDCTHDGGWFDYANLKINIGIKGKNNDQIFNTICHEMMEISALEMNVRLNRPDCSSDYIFVYDHRQHDTMMRLFSSAISQFIK